LHGQKDGEDLRGRDGCLYEGKMIFEVVYKNQTRKENEMKQYMPALFALTLTLTGCAIKHDYSWNEYAIAPERITSEIKVAKGQEIKVVAGKSSDATVLLGNVGLHQYYGSDQMLADGIAEQLSVELRKMGVGINNSANKSLEIAVTRSAFERGAWKIAATIEFTVKFGNGKTKQYSVRNSSPATVDRTFNGAVALSVIEMLNDPEVRNYIE
jgi:hypothetical protein